MHPYVKPEMSEIPLFVSDFRTRCEIANFFKVLQTFRYNYYMLSYVCDKVFLNVL